MYFRTFRLDFIYNSLTLCCSVEIRVNQLTSLDSLYFRILPETMNTLADLLYEPPEGNQPGPIPMDFTKAVAMTVAYLRSKEITYR